jgi:hypothetical protein
MSQIFEKIKGMDIIQNAMFSKLNELVENNKVEKEEDKETHKEKLDEIFKKKSIGRPSGNFEERQQQYFKLVSTGKIKSPVQKTLDYYQICKSETGEYIINVLPN